MSESIRLRATANVKLTKYDEDGNVIGIEEQIINLTEQEARELWLSQQQA